MKHSLVLVLALFLALPVSVAAQDDEYTGDSTLGFLAGEGLRHLDLPDEPDGKVRIVAIGSSQVDGSWAAVIYNGLGDEVVVDATVTPDSATGIEPSNNLVPGVVAPGQIGILVPDFPEAREAQPLIDRSDFDAKLDYETVSADDFASDLSDSNFDLYQPFPVAVTSAQTIPDSDEGPIILASFENVVKERITPAVVTAVCFDADGQVVQSFQQDTAETYSFIPPTGSSLVDIPYSADSGCESVIVAATSDLEVVD